jgi:hypothetical protein
MADRRTAGTVDLCRVGTGNPSNPRETGHKLLGLSGSCSSTFFSKTLSGGITPDTGLVRPRNFWSSRPLRPLRRVWLLRPNCRTAGSAERLVIVLGGERGSRTRPTTSPLTLCRQRPIRAHHVLRALERVELPVFVTVHQHAGLRLVERLLCFSRSITATSSRLGRRVAPAPKLRSHRRKPRP